MGHDYSLHATQYSLHAIPPLGYELKVKAILSNPKVPVTSPIAA